MTEFLKTITEFLQNDMTLANITVPLTALFSIFMSRVNAKLKIKAEEVKTNLEKANLELITKLNKEKTDNAKTGQAIKALTNMFILAFGNSKLASEVKVKLQEYSDKVYDLLEVKDTNIEKEYVSLAKETPVMNEKLVEEKTVIEQIKEEL